VSADAEAILALTAELCRVPSGVATPANEELFARIAAELPEGLTLHRFASGSVHNGWRVPPAWQIAGASLERDGATVWEWDGNPLAVAALSRSLDEQMDLEQLRPHLVSDPDRPDLTIFHCRWQYRPWEADWALCLPHRIVEGLEPGRYRVRIETRTTSGEMIVGVADHAGEWPQTVVLNAHTCHPGQANDGMVGVATLARLFQGLAGRRTRYSYRLVLGPEHLGTVFLLSQASPQEIERMVAGVFVEMTGVRAPLKVTATFRGGQPIDRAVERALAGVEHVTVGWRQGAGNDETVWEGPGVEVPFVELTRCIDQFDPFPQYHSDADTAGSLDRDRVGEAYTVLARLIGGLEGEPVVRRTFDGLICLSAPETGLYVERPDPAIVQDLGPDADRWGRMSDSLLRWMDGTMTVADIAAAAGLPEEAIRAYIARFETAGLVRVEHAPMPRAPISRAVEPLR
jgi:aminopeptidase-like protein